VECKIVLVDGGACVATWHNVAISLTRTRMQMPHVDAIDAAGAAIAPRYTRGILSLSIVPANSPPSSPEVRKRAGEALRASPYNAVRAGVVIEGGGVWGGAMRTLVLSFLKLARTSYPVDTYDSVAAAARVMAPQVRELAGVDASDADMVNAIAEMRADIDWRHPLAPA
jgi:hypothetical protein